MKKAGAQGGSGRPRKGGAHANASRVSALALAVLLVAVPGMPQRCRAESSGTSQYDVKAAFLFHFAQFVEWPAEAFKDEDSPLTYCTVGEETVRGALDESAKGKRIR